MLKFLCVLMCTMYSCGYVCVCEYVEARGQLETLFAGAFCLVHLRLSRLACQQVLGIFLFPFLRWITNAFWDLIHMLSQTMLLSELFPSPSIKNSSQKTLICGKICLVSPYPVFWQSTMKPSVVQLIQYC